MEQRLQEQIDSLHAEHQALRDRLTRVEAAVAALPEMDKKLDGIGATLGKYQGFMGGMAFLFTGIVLFVKGGWEVFTHWVTK